MEISRTCAMLDDLSLPNVDPDVFDIPDAVRVEGGERLVHPPRFLLLYGSLTWIIHRVGWDSGLEAAADVAIRGTECAMVGAGGAGDGLGRGTPPRGSRWPRSPRGEEDQAVAFGIARGQRQLDAGGELGHPRGHLDEGEADRVELSLAPERGLGDSPRSVCKSQ